MKVRRLKVQNARSFLNAEELRLDGDISIIIGPNGGGKTNLLDIATYSIRRHILTSWIRRHTPVPDNPQLYQFVENDSLNTPLERHNHGRDQAQILEIELELTHRDKENMEAMQRDADELLGFARNRFSGVQLQLAKAWSLAEILPGSTFTYTIVNNQLQPPSDGAAKVFREYLSLYDLDNQLRVESRFTPLTTPMLFLPVNRTASHFQSAVSLATHNDFDYKKAVEATSSRTPASFATLAVGRLASRFRLLLESDEGRTRAEFYEDASAKALTDSLGNLGYGWKLESTNALRNEYEIQLTKQGLSFPAGLASSGEKEILTYLFGIYALNIRDAIVVIDEPELHLHPKWQAILLKLFEKLAEDTGNQFLLATHSPIFVSPTSIQYVSRVFSKGQQSHIVRLKNAELPNAKHLFSIINSLNNERIFFCDKVILVEGISDRLFFEAVLKRLALDQSSGKIYEIVSVGGKGFFEAYKLLLNACKVPYALIADFDYLKQIGSEEIKNLFTTNTKAIKDDVIDNAGSRDGAALAARMDDAITSGNLDDLRTLWTYIKSRHLGLPNNLLEQDKERIRSFIKEKRDELVFVLSEGALENYLPVGYRGKSLDKLIEFLNDDNFWDQLPPRSQEEIREMAERIGKL